MHDKTSIVADALLSSQALKFGEFRLKSGLVSPYYIDLTWLFSSPEDLRRVVEVLAEEIVDLSSRMRIDKVASIELKGALILAAVSSRIDIPCLVVRKESKAYGLTGRIAGGEVEEGEHILFFDDVVTDGKSKIEGIRPLEEMGAEVKTILVVVDREQGGRENLQRMGYQLNSVTTISEIVKSLMETRKMSEEQARLILNYVKNSRRRRLRT
ncbi:orotate phosphoribosyltransferase [Candidatus Bathyarchaeota archaeon]|nr:MAG: orotate phosphoribosyltransferase [Candidatus Bathyarchaeota archaeon ex4484_40]RJS80148.1 MAG: orotate phosphoribosyltransferase [Candidatus Bathyarchaeota archaeon]